MSIEGYGKALDEVSQRGSLLPENPGEMSHVFEQILSCLYYFRATPFSHFLPSTQVMLYDQRLRNQAVHSLQQDREGHFLGVQMRPGTESHTFLVILGFPGFLEGILHVRKRQGCQDNSCQVQFLRTDEVPREQLDFQLVPHSEVLQLKLIDPPIGVGFLLRDAFGFGVGKEVVQSLRCEELIGDFLYVETEDDCSALGGLLPYNLADLVGIGFLRLAFRPRFLRQTDVERDELAERQCDQKFLHQVLAVTHTGHWFLQKELSLCLEGLHKTMQVHSALFEGKGFGEETVIGILEQECIFAEETGFLECSEEGGGCKERRVKFGGEDGKVDIAKLFHLHLYDGLVEPQRQDVSLGTAFLIALQACLHTPPHGRHCLPSCLHALLLDKLLQSLLLSFGCGQDKTETFLFLSASAHPEPFAETVAVSGRHGRQVEDQIDTLSEKCLQSLETDGVWLSPEGEELTRGRVGSDLRQKF